MKRSESKAPTDEKRKIRDLEANLKAMNSYDVREFSPLTMLDRIRKLYIEVHRLK